MSGSPKAPDGDFACGVCLDTATEPVVTKCGHLFCWPCLRRWLVHQQTCPTCKGAVNDRCPQDIIPLYGKGRAETTTPANASTAPPCAEGSTSQSDPHRVPADAAQARQGASSRPHGNREDAPQQAPDRWEANHLGMPFLGGTFLFFGGSSFLFWLPLGFFLLSALVPWQRWLGQLTNGNTERMRHYIFIGMTLLLLMVFYLSLTAYDESSGTRDGDLPSTVRFSSR